MNWIELGYWGMFVSSLLAATFIPLGSEFVFIALLTNNFNPIVLTIIAGTGNTTGGMITYYIGRLGKWEWLEKWFGINHNRLQAHMGKAQKHGWIYAFFTWLPGVGDIMAAAIGFARINPFTALIWMTLGKTLRFAIIAIIWKYSIELW